MATPLASRIRGRARGRSRSRRDSHAREIAASMAAAERAAAPASLRRLRVPTSTVVGHYQLPGVDNRPVTLTASAKVLHGATVTGTPKRAPNQDWQKESWTLRREIGEFRFVGDRTARAVSAARLFIARLPETQGAEPEPVTDGPIADLSRMLFGDQAAVSQQMNRVGQHLEFNGESLFLIRQAEDEAGTLTWSAHSVREITGQGDMMKLNDGVEDIELAPDDLVIRCWTPDPELGGLASCSAQSVMPVARELRGLTQHTSAQIDSRLAGNGLLVLPESIEVLAGQASNPDEGDEDGDMDDFVRALVESMTVPLRDRDSAASVVPLVIKVPDSVVDKIQHLTFSTPFDEMSKDLREENIRRVGLGMDSDPSVLLGMGSGNHWTAWLVSEDESKLVVAPKCATACHTFTFGLVRPLIEQVAPTEDPRNYLVWFDLSSLELRPDKSEDARSLHGDGLVSDAVALRENGFDPEADAPSKQEYVRRLLERLLFAKPDYAQQILPLLGVELQLPDAAPDPATDPAVPADPAAEDPGAATDPAATDGQSRDIPDTQNQPPPAASERPGPGQ